MIVPTQVRVLFINCPRLDTLACAYLLLAQNEIQREFEFSVHHYWVFAGQQPATSLWTRLLSEWSGHRLPFRKWALGRSTAALDLKEAPHFKEKMNSHDLSSHVMQLLQSHDAWYRNLPAS